MEKKLKTYTCLDCGAQYEADREKRNKRCILCSMKRVRESATQMMRKEGPCYERWKESMRNAVNRA